MEAALTCSNLIIVPGKPVKIRGPTAQIIELILSRLLEVAVSDPVSNVRLCIVKCFRPAFDRYLSQEHHIETLVFLLADECFEVRVEALGLLGRLATLNPAVVLPGLRQLLLHLIGQLTCSAESDHRTKEEATLLLCHFLRASSLQPVVKSYMVTLIRSILPPPEREKEGDVRLTNAGLEAIGELCMVMRTEVLPYGDQLLSIIISNMHDQSLRKKQGA
jgi:FKBP12-rapamycin complex-associated protein